MSKELENLPEAPPITVKTEDGEELSVFTDFLREKNRAGPRKTLTFDVETVKRLRKLKGIGMTYQDIAHLEEIDLKTLNAIFRSCPQLKKEIDKGQAVMRRDVRVAHYKNVLNSPNPKDQADWDYMRGGAKSPNRLDLRDDGGKKQAPEDIRPEARGAMICEMFKYLAGEGAYPGQSLSDDKVKKINAENERVARKALEIEAMFEVEE